jgi:sugar-specific transcriptional regulator TrmB
MPKQHPVATKPVEALQKAGLTPSESTVYVALLKLGETPIAPILKQTGLHSQIVYRAIDRLVERGLVSTFRRNRRTFVQAEEPSALVDVEKQRLQELELLVPMLNNLKKGKEDSFVRVSRGEQAIRDLRLRAIKELPKGGTHYVIGATGQRYYQVMQPAFLQIERLRISKKITTKLVAFESQRASIQKNAIKTLFDCRFLPSRQAAPTSTIVFNNTVLIQIWSEDPIIIRIDSKELAQNYLDYFNTLWKSAKT